MEIDFWGNKKVFINNGKLNPIDFIKQVETLGAGDIELLKEIKKYLS